ELRESTRIIKQIEAENEEMKIVLEPMINLYNVEDENLSDKLFIKLLRANEWQEVSLKTPLTDLEKKFEKLKGEFDALNELIKSERELYEHSVRDLSNIKNQIEIMKDNILKKVAYYGFET